MKKLGKKFSNIPKEYVILGIIIFLAVFISLFEITKPLPSSRTIYNKSPDSKITRLEKEEGNVTVIIEYLPDQSSSSLVFRIALDTHSVNLDSFNFQQAVILEKEGKSFSSSLVSPQGGGHHRSAEITFTKTDVPFTIVVKNLSQIPRREFVFEKI